MLITIWFRVVKPEEGVNWGRSYLDVQVPFTSLILTLGLEMEKKWGVQLLTCIGV